MSKVIVEVNNLSKEFRLPHEKQNSVKSLFVNMFRGRQSYERQKVLKNISFEIKEGEFFGIVGRNGSGKSTLLKLLAGIYAPDSGDILINGPLTPFIELGVGFSPELTGRENVFLNGALLGFSRKEMEAMYDDIVEFAELKRFMDQKLKNYSSGMQVRLAFSIAIRANSDILILDEVLAVGDEAFQKKCYSYFAELKNKKKTVILVTHDMNSVQRFCSRALLLEGGVITELGSITKVVDKYQELNRQNSSGVETGLQSNAEVQVVLRNQNNKILTQVKPNDTLLFTVDVTPDTTIKDAFVGFTIVKDSGELVYWFTTEPPRETIKQFNAGKKTTLKIEMDNIFGEATYHVNVTVKSNDRSQEYIVANAVGQFTVVGRGVNGWALHPTTKVRINQG